MGEVKGKLQVEEIQYLHGVFLPKVLKQEKIEQPINLSLEKEIKSNIY
jgi:hypothetical protein